MRPLILLALLLAVPAAAQADDPAAQVSEPRLRADVERMVAFGTRHTLSSLDDPTRGIGAALRWGAGEFEAASAACGGCLEVVTPERAFSGNRVPAGQLIRDVVAIQRGTAIALG